MLRYEVCTDASNELFFGKEVGLVVVELLEEPLAPVTIFVEEKEEVFEIHFMIVDTLCQVLVHEVQDIHLVLINYLTTFLTIQLDMSYRVGGLQSPVTHATSHL